MKVAVVGCGVMGALHSRIYNSLKGVELVAVCDTNIDAARRIGNQYKAKYYESYKDLLNNHQIDAASIAVPTIYHLPIALDFIKRKIPVLIEKPLADTSKAAKKIIDAALTGNVFIMTGHIERYNPALTKLQRLISLKAFGEIVSINIKRVGLFPQRITGSDVLTDLAVHDLDIATALTKCIPDYIYARGSGVLTKGRYDHAEIFLDFKKFGCFIQANWVTPIKIRQLSITGTKGYAELNYVTQELLVYKSKYKIIQPKGFKEFVAEFGEPEFRKLKIKNQEPLRLEVKNFIDSVNKKANPKITNDEALRAIYLAERARKSILLRKVVKI